MSDILVLGGGLAGLSAAAALGSVGHRVRVLEARPHLGGRATSYGHPTESSLTIDNCQHILLRCCHNLIDFYQRLGVADQVEWHRVFYFLEPGGRTSVLQPSFLPAPLHYSLSFLGLDCLNFGEKLALGRALGAMRLEARRKDLDDITMLAWLQRHNQPPRVLERFWRQVLVSAVNEELDRMSAAHGFQVVLAGFLGDRTAAEMGVPLVPLAELLRTERLPNVEIVHRTPVEGICVREGRVTGIRSREMTYQADQYVSALNFDKLHGLLPELPIEWPEFAHSSITGVHLWFDRPVTKLPHGTLLDRTIQWFFAKEGGRYVQIVVSASETLLRMGRQEVLNLTLRELAEFLPTVREARLERFHVAKEAKATFAAKPGLNRRRPTPDASGLANLTLAGDWTRTGWPSTMEGAVRSGYAAAERVSELTSRKQSFLLPS